MEVDIFKGGKMMMMARIENSLDNIEK